MSHIDFISKLHRATGRDYLARVLEADKAECATIACDWGEEYWDGDRKFGYGGYKYDGRWRQVAQEMISHYGLTDDSRILDVGCGKGFLIYELSQLLPGSTVIGLDISPYAILNSKAEISSKCIVGDASHLPFEDSSFDLVLSITTLHNLFLDRLFAALEEIERVSAADKYIVVEAYRSEQEKVNLLYWQLTCRSFHTPDEWVWTMRKANYSGDYGFIFFE